MFEQERFIGRLQRHVMAEPDVLVCFLYGSFGRRAEDAYSDVDIALIFAGQAERDKAWAGRQEFVKAVMPYVAVRSFDAGHVRPYLHVALYSNGTKADYRFDTMDGIAPNPVDGKLRILKDTDGWGERFGAASARLAPAQPYISPDELTALDNRFWVMYWDVLRLLKRGDTDNPFPTYLKLLYFTLPPLRDALPPEEPARQGLARVLYSRDAGQPYSVWLNCWMSIWRRARPSSGGKISATSSIRLLSRRFGGWLKDSHAKKRNPQITQI